MNLPKILPTRIPFWRGYRNKTFAYVVFSERGVIWHSTQAHAGWGLSASAISRRAMWDAILASATLTTIPVAAVDRVVAEWQWMPYEGWLMSFTELIRLVAEPGERLLEGKRQIGYT